MLVPAPYQAPEKKAKKKAKGTRGGLRPKGTSDMVSEDAETHSAAEDDREEQEGREIKRDSTGSKVGDAKDERVWEENPEARGGHTC